MERMHCLRKDVPHKACSFWLNFCTGSSFFLFFPPEVKRKKDELVQKFSQKEQVYSLHGADCTNPRIIKNATTKLARPLPTLAIHIKIN
ncbi:hypothetical protein ALC57_14126 [Trachymyrmex cornetzi]|uniref:Uncharacterized protein n=1 Tax=Trachymyrmex cornetzi TaxID=471704 RepID=A0A151IZ23_9HYME|nr:hypothetical protein ALC57_14126 [Trachymyrmex cornetzi]